MKLILAIIGFVGSGVFSYFISRKHKEIPVKEIDYPSSGPGIPIKIDAPGTQTHEPMSDTPNPSQEQIEPPAPIPAKTKREYLYEVAYKCIGRDMSPADVAPDSLACAESINGVFKEAFGEFIGSGAALTSTAALYQTLRTDSRFELVINALPGDIVISPTGTSTKGSAHGHVGIWGKETIMSNDSSTGKWLANYLLRNWKLVFHDTLGFPVFYFRVKGNVDNSNAPK